AGIIELFETSVYESYGLYLQYGTVNHDNHYIILACMNSSRLDSLDQRASEDNVKFKPHIVCITELINRSASLCLISSNTHVRLPLAASRWVGTFNLVSTVRVSP
ncbi:hypothetical protein ACJX0J_022118, partial [Zea mays]